MDEAVELAPTVRSAYLVLVELRQPLQFEDYLAYSDKISKARKEVGMAYLQPFRARLEAAGVRVDAGILSGDPVIAIAEIARKEPFDLVLLGADGGPLARYFGPARFANPLARRVETTVLRVRNTRRKPRQCGPAPTSLTNNAALAPWRG